MIALISPKTLCLAADPGVGAGMFIVLVLAYLAQWGWVAGLVCLLAAIPLRHSRAYSGGCLLIALLTVGALLLVSSATLQAGL